MEKFSDVSVKQLKKTIYDQNSLQAVYSACMYFVIICYKYYILEVSP